MGSRSQHPEGRHSKSQQLSIHGVEIQSACHNSNTYIVTLNPQPLHTKSGVTIPEQSVPELPPQVPGSEPLLQPAGSSFQPGIGRLRNEGVGPVGLRARSLLKDRAKLAKLQPVFSPSMAEVR